MCPEPMITEQILKLTGIPRLTGIPEALPVMELANGRVGLAAARAVDGGAWIGHPVSDLRRHPPSGDVRIAAIAGQDRPIIPRLRQRGRPSRGIMIAGGGTNGARLARERYFQAGLDCFS